MNLKDCRNIFIATSLILTLIAVTPSLSLVAPLSGNEKHFSEFWLLGPGHKAENYPHNLLRNETALVFVGIDNHLGKSAYYLVYVKIRNQMQTAPDNKRSLPSPLDPLYEFQAIIANGGKWEQQLTFSFAETSEQNGLLTIQRIRINNFDIGVNLYSIWNSTRLGFYVQLFLELWVYEDSVSGFRYQNQYVGLWLNLTA